VNVDGPVSQPSSPLAATSPTRGSHSSSTAVGFGRRRPRVDLIPGVAERRAEADGIVREPGEEAGADADLGGLPRERALGVGEGGHRSASAGAIDAAFGGGAWPEDARGREQGEGERGVVARARASGRDCTATSCRTSACAEHNKGIADRRWRPRRSRHNVSGNGHLVPGSARANGRRRA
jgi:hypothetical protein